MTSNFSEHVQRFFTSRNSSIRYLSYPELLAILDLETCEIRHLHFDLLMYLKIFHCLVAINHSDHFKYSNSTSLSTRSGGPTLVTPIGHTNKLNNFFFHNIHLWNSLPPVRNDPSIFLLKTLSLIDLPTYLKDDFYRSFY